MTAEARAMSLGCGSVLFLVATTAILNELGAVGLVTVLTFLVPVVHLAQDGRVAGRACHLQFGGPMGQSRVAALANLMSIVLLRALYLLIVAVQAELCPGRSKQEGVRPVAIAA
jgi:hypothetical protein